MGNPFEGEKMFNGFTKGKTSSSGPVRRSQGMFDNPFGGGGGGGGLPNFGGGGNGGMNFPGMGSGGFPGMGGGGNNGNMNTPFGEINFGQWLGLTKPDKPQTVGEATKDIIGALTTNLPAYNKMLRQESVPFAQTENRLRAIMQEGEKNRIGDIGQKSVRRTKAIARETDPEYFANRATVARNLQDLMKPGLTGGEVESIRRGLRTDSVSRGTGNVDSNINTIAGATTFGQAARDRLQSATALAGSLQPNLQFMSPETTFSIASGRDIMTPGTSQSEGFGQSLFQTKLAEMGLLGNRENTYHGGLGKLVQSVCGCYIFREHYGVDIPWWVVFARDRFHEHDPMLGYGYKNMAKWLVPMMRKWKIVRKLVEWTMIWPLTKYGGYLYYVEGHDKWWFLKPIEKFWFAVWRKLA